MTIQAKRSATIEDVARHAGVSRAAVSKVIRDAYGVSDEMRLRVHASIAELGYRPRAAARAMRGSSYTLGFEIPSIRNHFFPKIITGALAALAGTRYQLIVAPAGLDPDGARQAVQVLIDRQVDGFMTISPTLAPEWFEEIGQRTPVVMLGRHDASINYDTIAGDDIAGARLAVGHLRDLGHRDIVHLTSTPEAEANIPSAPHIVRAAGYERAMTELGCGDRIRIVHVEPNEGASRDAALALLSGDERPSAIFAGHDELALGVLQATAELGLTPAEVSVIGYDDTDIAAYPAVSMTSINQFGTRMGQIVIELLLDRIAGRTEPVHEVIAPRLMVRHSTAPWSGGASRAHTDVRQNELSE
ncbi:MAG: LacI family DNA-binding transcriptional regulator [Propionibacteriaceae bacterium]|nr:LacI family DNA-binding transcriptional regulator [Propionibacteriaceae bacterium]